MHYISILCNTLKSITGLYDPCTLGSTYTLQNTILILKFKIMLSTSYQKVY